MQFQPSRLALAAGLLVLCFVVIRAPAADRREKDAPAPKSKLTAQNGALKKPTFSPRDEKEFQFTLEHGTPAERFELAETYRKHSDEWVFEKQFYLYQSAAEANHPAATRELARAYSMHWYRSVFAAPTLINKPSYEKSGEKAFTLARKALELGDRESLLILSGLYSSGRGVAKDIVVAEALRREAYEKGVDGALLAVLPESKSTLTAVERAKLYENICSLSPRGWRDEFAISSAMWLLGLMCWDGEGVIRDQAEAYKWVTLSASRDFDRAKHTRDAWEAALDSSTLANGRRMAREFLTAQIATTAKAKVAVPTSERRALGTGFLVSSDGYLLTNHHVIAKAAHFAVRVEDREVPAKLVKVDRSNDIAVLKIEGTYRPVPLGRMREATIGASVWTMGFPNPDIQGRAPKYTRGEISSLTGMGDDPRYFQITAPIQPGNSGGPLLDSNGRVIGIVSSQLDALQMVERSGSIPQNVNYALKITYSEALAGEIIGSKEMPLPSERTPQSLIQACERAVVLILGSTN